MWKAALLASLLATTGALVTGQAARQEPNRSAFIAFRVDDLHAIATIATPDMESLQIEDGLSPEPAARFGFRYFDLPEAWRGRVPTDLRAGARWLIHVAPGAAVQAEAERIVAGQPGCGQAIGMLLKVSPEHSDAFAKLPAKYFLAEPTASAAAASSSVRAVSSPSSPEFRRAVESTLNELLLRELPAIRAEAEPEVERMASSTVNYHRSWARDRRAVDEAMQRGEGKLTYDIQSFSLSPDRAPIHFVRAEWKVRSRQGFAATLWLRGEQSVEIVEQNLRPASWLRTFEFQGAVSREQLGLVLNVLDRNHDGWGEVLMAQGGYESLAISLLEYSATGFHPTGIEYAFGC